MTWKEMGEATKRSAYEADAYADPSPAPDPGVLPDPAIEVLEPARLKSMAVFASPHSGRIYPRAFLAASSLDPLSLRRSEDGFVDEIYLDAPAFGAPLLRALFPRAYIDANREAYELDPRMFSDALPSYVNTKSSRVAAGLGSIPRIVADGAEIYARKLTFTEAKARVRTCHAPYHAALQRLIGRAKTQFGAAMIIDCHSMPSGRPRGQIMEADIILGDRFGASCAPGLTRLVEHLLEGQGYRVARNAPYAGGYTTAHYGRPDDGVHALQIEINRALYMDEARMLRGRGLETVRRDIKKLIAELSAVDPAVLRKR